MVDAAAASVVSASRDGTRHTGIGRGGRRRRRNFCNLLFDVAQPGANGIGGTARLRYVTKGVLD